MFQQSHNSISYLSAVTCKNLTQKFTPCQRLSLLTNVHTKLEFIELQLTALGDTYIRVMMSL